MGSALASEPFGEARKIGSAIVSELFGRKIGSAIARELFGAAETRFGYSWYDRTYGLGAVRIESTSHGITDIRVIPASETTHSEFTSKLSGSNTMSWFHLMKGEFLTVISVRETRYEITGLCFTTNLRNSQWCGSEHGTLRRITAPSESLREAYVDGARWVTDSEIIGKLAYDEKSRDSTEARVTNPRGMVVTFKPQLQRVLLVSEAEYQRHLTMATVPLEDGVYLVVFAKGERITAFRACISDDRISAVQIDTTLRTTKWFGPVPDAGAVVEARSIHDVPGATHIGGIFSMEGTDCLKSIGVSFYKPAE